MPHPRNDWLSQNLQTLLQAAPDLDALILVSMDGIEIASAMPQGVNTARFSAMALAVFTLSEQIAAELQRDRLEEVYIRGKHGYIVITQIDKRAILVALAREGIKSGLVLLELRRIAKRLLAIKKEFQKQSGVARSGKSQK